MDTLTHALSGALLGRATAPRAPKPGELSIRERVAIGAFAAAFPDIDFVVSYLSPLAYLHHHRGLTHSLLALPLWALLLGWLCALVIKRDRARWRECAVVIGLGIGIHIAGDLITSFGTMVFAPLTNARYAWSTTFIIDLWFSGIIITALAACAVWRRTRVPAVMGLCALTGYVGFQYVQRERAIDFGIAYARTLGLPESAVSAVPRPVSPYNWMVVVAAPERLHYSQVSLLRREPPPALSPDAGFFERLAAPYLPLAHAIWSQAPRYGERDEDRKLAREAWSHPQFDFFRWFAAYPALYRIERDPPASCVWFEDLRFLTPGRSRVPFRYGMCRGAGGGWLPFELLDDGQRSAVH